MRRQQGIALELRVYPNLRRPHILRALRTGRENLHVTRRVGRGREFEKLQEYTPGDGYDEIHWKATGRRGRPITKVYQVERTQQIYLVIDASRLSAQPVGGQPVLDRAITTALTMSAISERNGDLFGIVVCSDRVETFVRALRGKPHVVACRDALNEHRSHAVSPDFDEVANFLRLQLRKRSLVVFLRWTIPFWPNTLLEPPSADPPTSRDGRHDSA